MRRDILGTILDHVNVLQHLVDVLLAVLHHLVGLIEHLSPLPCSDGVLTEAIELQGLRGPENLRRLLNLLSIWLVVLLQGIRQHVL